MQMFRFGRFDIDTVSRALRSDGQVLAIGARAYDLLVALVERHDRVVGKDELLDLVWAGVIVEEGNLAVQISAIRKLIGADAIATVPGRGYRFVATLETQFGAAVAALRGPPRAAREMHLLGREADLAIIRGMLADHPLVTVVGGGGVGKSALALTIARNFGAEGLFDEVRIVELASIVDADRLAASVASALQVPHGGKHIGDAIGRAMRSRHAFVVLDNCEHVIGEVAALVSVLLREAPGVVMLATSQVPLKIAGERVHRLSGLDVPVDLAVKGALALFEARVQSALPRFALAGEELEDAADICRRLDGNPLAIQLATARVPLLGVEGVRARLDDRFRLLRSDARFESARHRSLHEAVRWSEELLAPQEKAVLRRLAVFAGSFGLAEAQRVGSDRTSGEWEVLDHLSTLVDRSLVTIEPGPVPRYRLLETVRLYAAERLAGAGETEATRARHAEALAADFEGLDDRRWEMTSEQAHALLAPEIDNVRAALGWAREAEGRASLGLGLAARAMWLWDTANLTAEGAEYLAFFEKAAAREAITPPLRALFWSARTFDSPGFDASRPSPLDMPLAELATAGGDSTDPKERRFVYDAFARAAIHDARTGRLDAANKRLKAARALEEREWPPRKVAMRWFAEGELAEAEDRLADALAAQEARTRLVELAGEQAAQLHATALLIVLLVEMGEVDAALARAAEVVAAVSPRLPDHRTRSLRVAWADALVAAGRPDQAAAMFALALPLYEGSASQWSLLDPLANLCAARGHWCAAAQTLACADHAWVRRGFVRKPYMQRARQRLANVLAGMLQPAELARQEALGASLSETQVIAFGARVVAAPVEVTRLS